MRIVAYTNGLEHQEVQVGWFLEGLARHGIDARHIRHDGAEPAPEPCDLAVFWGHRRRRVIEAQRQAGKPYLVLERGYVGDRFFWTSAGINGLNGRADFGLGRFAPDGPPGHRWSLSFDGKIQPWRGVRRKQEGVALLIGQVPGDASVEGVDLQRWYREAHDALCARGWRVVFRPHPAAGASTAPEGFDVQEGPLAAALEAVDLVVTWNSNTAVDAMLAGVPTIACDEGSMAWPVAARGLKALDGPLDPAFSDGHARPGELPARVRWAHGLAWCQWSPEEIRAGLAWRYHIRPAVERHLEGRAA